MGLAITSGAIMQCTFGVSPCPLNVLPILKPMLPTGTVANILDFIPFLNIANFGMCNTPSNPVVAAATAAKLGVFTPAACVPAIVSPWLPTDLDTMFFAPALTSSSKTMCAWGGVVSITTPLPVNVTI
ncbi:MAG: DUF4280 domain-containing protein [bacterium]|nr:DUF4280 domain-containing protein [bacterium]